MFSGISQISDQSQRQAKMRPSKDKPKDTLCWARRATLGAWLSGLASIGLVWVQSRWYVFHPHYLPLCLLYIALLASTVLALVCCLWRIVRGPQRIQAAILAAVALLPAGFW